MDAELDEPWDERRMPGDVVGIATGRVRLYR